MNTLEHILQPHELPPEESIFKSLTFFFKEVSSHRGQAIITVSHAVIETLKKQTIQRHKKNIQANGLKEVPDSYIEENYKTELIKGLNHFILNHFVIDFLMQELIEKKILITNYPRLSAILQKPSSDFIYTFEISLADHIDIREWKNFSFKAPKRKNYKDLDKQVTLFLRDQCDVIPHDKASLIENNDWVYFDAHLVDVGYTPFTHIHHNNLWLKIQTKTIEQPLFEKFLGKKIGDHFITADLSFFKDTEYIMCDKLTFKITVQSIVKGGHFALEPFKLMFKLKNKAEIHEKLIEVFSYRNDVSQRKAIIEEMFHLFFSKHRFEVPKHLVLRKQEEILSIIKKRPDFQVYKMQKNFSDQVALLAEKQLKEEILIDQIAGNENIKVDIRDIQSYLNLFTNERLKEFVYFKPPNTSLEETPLPLHNSMLKHVCRREKTLNIVLHHLTH